MPDSYNLGEAGSAWWRWAWTLPQAAAWSVGDLYALARRARLEDDVVALRTPPKLDLEPLIEAMSEGCVDSDTLHSIGEHIRYVMGVLKSLAGQKSVIEREMRELDDRFGLTPKGLAALRWTIVDDEKPATNAKPSAAKRPQARGHLRAVDPALVG